jgi:multidrug efflux system membrane fusion protein
VPGTTQTELVGELTITNYAVGADANRIYLRAIFPNEDEMLLPGERVNIELTLSTHTNAIVVPSSSVWSGQQGQYVLVVKTDSTVEARPVAVSDRVGLQMVVRNGLRSGEQVVTSSQVPLASGMKVRIENQMAVSVVANRENSE